MRLKLHSVPHGVGVTQFDGRLDEGRTLWGGHPNIIQDSNMIQDEKVLAQ